MDPTAAVTELRDLAQAHMAGEDSDLCRVLDLITDLDNWLSRGGFLPAQWTR